MGWSGGRGIAQLGDLPCDGTRSASWQRSLVDPWYERSATPRYLIAVRWGTSLVTVSSLYRSSNAGYHSVKRAAGYGAAFWGSASARCRVRNSLGPTTLSVK